MLLTVKQPECQSCENLRAMVRTLSALIDIAELPPGFGYENYQNLLAGRPLTAPPPPRVKRGPRGSYARRGDKRI